MQTTFKRHEKVRLRVAPREADIEPYADPPQEIKAGMVGTINTVLQNGRYHVRIADDKDNEIAYVAMSEENLEIVA